MPLGGDSDDTSIGTQRYSPPGFLNSFMALRFHLCAARVSWGWSHLCFGLTKMKSPGFVYFLQRGLSLSSSNQSDLKISNLLLEQRQPLQGAAAFCHGSATVPEWDRVFNWPVLYTCSCSLMLLCAKLPAYFKAMFNILDVFVLTCISPNCALAL